MSASEMVQSGLVNMCKSFFNIDPAEMREAMIVFQNLVGDIHLNLKAIREEQAVLRSLLERMDNRIGGIGDGEDAGRQDDGPRNESNQIGNGGIIQTSRN
jgi:hypothetical protein